MSVNSAVKIIALLKRKSGISREVFRDYYENKHVPLIMRLLPYMADYRRNYVLPASGHDDSGIADADCDVVTEAWFITNDDFKAFSEAAARKDIQEQIAADESEFLDRSSIRMFAVEERTSDASRK